VCKGPLVHYDKTVRERVATPVRRMCECVRVHWYTMTKQTGSEWPGPGRRNSHGTGATSSLVGTSKYYPARHPTHFEPSLLELNRIM